MECPKCGKKAYVLETRDHRPRQGEPIVQYRRYICENWRCNTVFVYRNTFFEFRDVKDATKLLMSLKRQGKDIDIGQEEINFEDES